MKTRTYCITSGQYDGYRVLAHLVGPARPALSTLWKTFLTRYHVLPKPSFHVKKIDYALMEEHGKASMSEYAAGAALKKEGLTGLGLEELFVSWLKRDHGFTDAEITDFWL